MTSNSTFVPAFQPLKEKKNQMPEIAKIKQVKTS